MKNKMKYFALAMALIINIRMIITWKGDNVILGLIGTGGALLLIFFPEQISKMAMYTGGIRHPRINKETPGCLIAMAGWIVMIFMAYISVSI